MLDKDKKLLAQSLLYYNAIGDEENVDMILNWLDDNQRNELIKWIENHYLTT